MNNVLVIYRARHLFNQFCLFAAVTSLGSGGGSAVGTPGPQPLIEAVQVVDEENAESVDY